MTRPSFSAKFLRDGSTSYRCNETGTRYIVANAGADHCAYREGELLVCGPRDVVVDAVERNAKWELRA